MHKTLLLTFFASIVVSCMIDVWYDLPFANKSDKDIIVVADLNHEDGNISVGSMVERIKAGEASAFVSSRHWYNKIQDSMFIYVLDKKKVEDVQVFNHHYVEEEDLDMLRQEWIIGRMTVLKSQVGCSFSYPPSGDVRWVSYK